MCWPPCHQATQQVMSGAVTQLPACSNIRLSTLFFFLLQLASLCWSIMGVVTSWRHQLMLRHSRGGCRRPVSCCEWPGYICVGPGRRVRHRRAGVAAAAAGVRAAGQQAGTLAVAVAAAAAAVLSAGSTGQASADFKVMRRPRCFN
jgi:hypothetical protein